MFGGAIIPAATGCIVAAVPPELRQLASAGSMFFFQQLGYALSPLVSSLVASSTKIDCPTVFSNRTVLVDGSGLSSENAVLACDEYQAWQTSSVQGAEVPVTFLSDQSVNGTLMHAVYTKEKV